MKRTIILVTLATIAVLFTTVFNASASHRSENGTMPGPNQEEGPVAEELAAFWTSTETQKLLWAPSLSSRCVLSPGGGVSYA